MKETRTRNQGDRMPRPKPVDKIPLPENHLWLRVILTVLFLAAGAYFLATGVSQLSAKDSGWSEIEAVSSELNCGEDFALHYCLGEGNMSVTAENKALSICYSDAAEYAFRMFTVDVEYEGVSNLYYISRHPNEEIVVDDVLYQAFSLIQDAGDRRLYLAPAYEQYGGLFSCSEDHDAVEFDPRWNPSIADYCGAIANYASDPEMIDLELLGDHRVILRVSDAYLSFAKENKIECLIDFGWMKNAFIIDYLADVLEENGFNHGYLTSYDGFTRNLDNRDQTYLFKIYDRKDGVICQPARIQLTPPVSIVALRNYPLTEKDIWHYYTYESGEIATAFLDPADGTCKSAADNLISYCGDLGCAEILLQTAPIFVAEELRTDALSALADKGIYSLWSEGTALKYNEADLNLELLPESLYSSSLE